MERGAKQLGVGGREDAISLTRDLKAMGNLKFSMRIKWIETRNVSPSSPLFRKKHIQDHIGNTNRLHQLTKSTVDRELHRI